MSYGVLRRGSDLGYSILLLHNSRVLWLVDLLAVNDIGSSSLHTRLHIVSRGVERVVIVDVHLLFWCLVLRLLGSILLIIVLWLGVVIGANDLGRTRLHILILRLGIDIVVIIELGWFLVRLLGSILLIIVLWLGVVIGVNHLGRSRLKIL